jgi:VWFA-related protein
MFFDDISSPLSDLASARKAGEGYIKKGLEPGEKVGLFTASSFFRLDFTEDAAALLGGLPKIIPHVRRAEDAIGCPRMNPYQAWAIIHHGYQSQEFQVALAEALACPQNSGVPPGEITHLVEMQAQRTLDVAGQISDGILEKAFNVIKLLSAQPGHRVLLFASSGFFAQELQSQREQLVNAALHSKVVINTLDAKGLFVDADLDFTSGPPTIISPDLMVARSMIANTDAQFKNDPLALLAEETGGRFFHNSNDLTRGVQELSESPEFSYVLGFAPDSLRQDGAFHSLKVKLANSHGLTISAREGYYAPKKPKDMTADEKMVKFEREVMASDALSAIPINLDIKTTKLQNGDSDLNLASQVGVARLPFRKDNDRSAERLIMVTALFNEKNEFLTGTEQIVDLSLKPETFAKLAREGFSARISVEAPPGNYRVRQVVIEVATGKMAAINQTVAVQ